MPPRLEVGEEHVLEERPYRLEGPECNPDSTTNSRDTSVAINESRPGSQHREGTPRALMQIPFLDRLRALPKVRPVPWRVGQELPPEKSTDSPRVQQRGACLLSTRGKIVETPCTHCASGFGRFSHCITLDDWFQGACSTCIFTSKGNKCSLRIETLGVTDARSLRYAKDGPQSSGKKRKKQPSAVDTSGGSDSTSGTPYRSPYGPTFEPPANLLKMDQPRLLPAPVSAPSPARSPDIDAMLQTQRVRDAPSPIPGSLHHIEKKQRRQYGTNHQPNILPNPNPNPITKFDRWSPSIFQMDPHRTLSTPRELLSRTSSPALQPPRPNYLPRPDDPARSVPPGMNLIQPLVLNDVTRPNWPENIGGRPAPLIETLPQAQQRHVYGLIRGIQGGIENLQRQVELLQSAMGMEAGKSPPGPRSHRMHP
ncbi:hypothetical protein B7494_g585 [Chlorociboria aeruginascens]|nr:hypothetical protein B7494_g585 [Chlorociboria aeruginascens]